MSNAGTKRYARLLQEVRDLLNQHDPVGLIAAGAPSDEYEPTAEMILPRLKGAASSRDVGRILEQIFERRFGADTMQTWTPSSHLKQGVWAAWQRFETSGPEVAEQ